jgi:pyruvate,water dikinase
MCAEQLARALGVHPRKLLATGAGEKLLQHFSREIVRVARDFAPRPVAYRTLDLSTDAYMRLEGGSEFEKQEEAPRLDLRGCSRYLADEASFRLELRAVKRARDMGCVNLDLLLPTARTPDELASCREIVIEEGLFASAEFELWMTAEVPSTVLLIEEFLAHVSGVAINQAGLARHVVGIEGEGDSFAAPSDESHPAVIAAMVRVARAFSRRGVACSICGDLAGESPDRGNEIIRALVESGATGWIASPECYEKIAEDIARAEAALGIPAEREVAK